jgi:hypothetical protein
MTREEWDAGRKQHEETMAAMDRKDEEDQRKWEDQRREKWGKNTKALEALDVTGDILEDTRAFFEAAQIDPNTLDSPYPQAFRKGDTKLMLEYFNEIHQAAGTAPAGMSPGALEYFATFDKTVKKIIDAVEAKARS